MFISIIVWLTDVCGHALCEQYTQLNKYIVALTILMLLLHLYFCYEFVHYVCSVFFFNFSCTIFSTIFLLHVEVSVYVC